MFNLAVGVGAPTAFFCPDSSSAAPLAPFDLEQWPLPVAFGKLASGQQNNKTRCETGHGVEPRTPLTFTGKTRGNAFNKRVSPHLSMTPKSKNLDTQQYATPRILQIIDAAAQIICTAWVKLDLSAPSPASILTPIKISSNRHHLKPTRILPRGGVLIVKSCIFAG